MKHVGYNFVCTVEHSDLFSVCFTERIHFSSPIYATVPPKTDPLVWSGLVYLVICLLHGSSFFFFFEALWHSLTFEDEKLIRLMQ